MRLSPIFLGALLCCAVAGAEAGPPFRGGSPSGAGGGGGSPSACDGGSSVCASFKDGQTFVTWNDCAADAADGNNCRYRVYRSTSPINSGNYTSATLIASYVLNNSGSCSAATRLSPAAPIHAGIPAERGRPDGRADRSRDGARGL